ncbi:SH3 domain-containing protein [Leptospira bouyouniensis]|uniref:SH3 domain-containing protein n=1 Tax=Leptospira bouyouniensis TaxID=2484911 RepID=UPI0014384465|nr:SH3 domain-containing protein [Leptospira bouyouniensis]
MKIKTLFFLIIIYFSINCLNNYSKKVHQNEQIDAIKNSPKILKRVTTDGGDLLLREAPNTKAKILLKIRNGDYVEFLEENPEITVINGKSGNWTKVSFEGKAGWVFGGYIRDLQKGSRNTIKICEKGGIDSGIEESLEKEFGQIGNTLPYKHLLDGTTINKKENNDIFAYNKKFNGEITLSYFAEYGRGEIVVIFKNRKLNEVFEMFRKCDSRLVSNEDLNTINVLSFDFIDKDEPENTFWEQIIFSTDGNNIIVNKLWSD